MSDVGTRVVGGGTSGVEVSMSFKVGREILAIVPEDVLFLGMLCGLSVFLRSIGCTFLSDVMWVIGVPTFHRMYRFVTTLTDGRFVVGVTTFLWMYSFVPMVAGGRFVVGVTTFRRMYLLRPSFFGYRGDRCLFTL